MTLALNPYGCAGRLTMRGDPTNRRELLAGFLLVLLILALVAIALQRCYVTMPTDTIYEAQPTTQPFTSHRQALWGMLLSRGEISQILRPRPALILLGEEQRVNEQVI